jgi:CRP-like cAMP-binding protein
MSARPTNTVLDLTERMLHLRQIPVATMLPTPVIRMLASSMRDRRFLPGRKVLTQGTPMDAMYLLTDGGFDLVRGGAPFGSINAPQTVGFLPILARQETPYDAIAKEDTRALELDTDTLLELFADHFELLAATLRYLAERLWLEFQELPQEALGIPPMDLGPIGARPLDLVERMLVFRKTSGFATANLNGLATLARQVEEVRVPPGTDLWKPGESAYRVIFLVKGTIVCKTEDGRVFRYGPGTGVGGIEALADRPRWYTATTETDIVGFYGHTENLFDLFEHQQRMAMDFVAMLAKAQIGLLERKAKLGQNPLAAVQKVQKLGAIRYGA